MTEINRNADTTGSFVQIIDMISIAGCMSTLSRKKKQ